jgi:serine/threonine-protein kinase
MDESSHPPTGEAERPSAERIREQVERIIRSRIFARANRMKRFLSYTVEQALKGEEESIKEYSVALAVFDKPQSFDPRLDPIVRVEAGRLRTKIRQYYDGPGRRDPIRIVYRKRSYNPNFEVLSSEGNETQPKAVADLGKQRVRVGTEKPARSQGHQEFRAIAVLPFINLSVPKKREYIGDAITEEIINLLNQTVRLSVVSRTSVSRFKHSEEDVRKIADRLGADAVLEGSVRLTEKRIRVTAQLANGADGFQLWSQIFDRKVTDIFDVQREIGQAIVKTLKAELLDTQLDGGILVGTKRSEAYYPYLRGRYLLKRRLRKDVRSAIRLFEEAVERDPEYALAYVGSADAYAILCWLGALAPEQGWPKVSEMANKGLQLDGTLGAGHIALGHFKAVYEWKWEDAEELFLRGLELNPDSATGHCLYGLECLLPQGMMKEAEANIRKACKLDPSSPAIWAALGWTLYCRRLYPSAMENLAKSSKIDPLFYLPYLYMGYTYEQQGELDQALAAIKKAEELSRGEPIAMAALGRCMGLLDRNEEARDILGALSQRSRRSYVSPVDMSNIYIGLGEIECAVECIERGLDYRCGRATHLNVSPAYDALMSEGKVVDLLKRMRLDRISHPGHVKPRRRRSH